MNDLTAAQWRACEVAVLDELLRDCDDETLHALADALDIAERRYTAAPCQVPIGGAVGRRSTRREAEAAL